MRLKARFYVALQIFWGILSGDCPPVLSFKNGQSKSHHPLLALDVLPKILQIRCRDFYKIWISQILWAAGRRVEV
jgi:hypothetical protein